MRPFFSFFGSKWRSAPHYPAPRHAALVEPFAGSAGYATRYPDREVILIEKDETIAALWAYLIAARPEEIRALPLLTNDQTVDDLHCVDEAKFLIGFWINKASTVPKKSPSVWIRKNDELYKKYSIDQWWGVKIRERVATQVDQIKHWRLVVGSYENAPEIEATWFIDPPYEKAGKHYRHKSSALDFDVLGMWCRERRGQVLVCENEGAAWLPFETFKTVKAMEGRQRTGKSVEVLWTGS